MSAQSEILLINQYFAPSDNATAVILSELAEGLSESFKLTVVCESAGDSPETEHAQCSTLRFPPPGWIDRERLVSSSCLRWIAACMFMVRVAWHLCTSPRRHLVLLASEPPFIDTLGGLICWARRQPYLLLIQDLYPEFASAVRLRPVCWFSTPLARLHSFVARHARAIITISHDHQDLLAQRGVLARHVVPNWAPRQVADAAIASSSISPPSERQPLIVQYAGNIGLSCDLDTFEGALTELDKRGTLRDFQFIVRGIGLKAAHVSRLAQRYSQVVLEERVAGSEVASRMARCHAHLVLMPEALKGCVYPSKIYSIMAVGRPIIASVPRASESARFVEQLGLGYVSAAGCPSSLADALERCRAQYAAEPHVVEGMGARGIPYGREMWNRTHALNQYRAIIEEALAHRG